jgi:protein-S-isoprenylcysteine O-methyltransferase Ste14
MSEQKSQAARDNAGVIAPPPVIALATVFGGLVMDWEVPFFVLGPYFSWPVRLSLGGLLIAAGVVLAMAAERRFRSVGTNVPPWKPALALATGGIYQWLRNPMYVGLGLMVAGIGIGLGSEWTLILLAPAAWLMHNGVVLREERYLEAKFGDDYRHYKASVPRYGWPR